MMTKYTDSNIHLNYSTYATLFIGTELGFQQWIMNCRIVQYEYYFQIWVEKVSLWKFDWKNKALQTQISENILYNTK